MSWGMFRNRNPVWVGVYLSLFASFAGLALISFSHLHHLLVVIADQLIRTQHKVLGHADE
jgi:hypothetical protein